MTREALAALEQRARELLSPAAFSYLACGSGDEVTSTEAVAAWDDWRLRPRALVDVSSVETSCELLGSPAPSPILVAPTAFHLVAHEEGELASAAGASDAGAIYVAATRATHTVEEIASVAPTPWWFQVYVLSDRRLTAELVERAVASGASALVLTGDTPMLGSRPRSLAPPVSEEQYLVNLRPHLMTSSPDEVHAATSQDSSITEAEIGWLGQLSGLPVVVKGVLRGDDALRFVRAGAAGVVVSNHGGRQLDGAVATAHALVEVVDALRSVPGEGGDAVPVLVDGGIRDGATVLKALALGASGVMIGRPVLFALATGGREGVRELLSGLNEELAVAMALAGAPTIGSCTRDLVCHADGRACGGST